MANDMYYFGIEERVMKFEKEINALLDTLAKERAMNSDTGLLNADQYDAQGTLRVNMLSLARKLQATAELIEQYKDDSNYRAWARYSK